MWHLVKATVITASHQKFVLMFGLEHGGHLLQVEPVSLLFKLWGEEDGDDPLCDVSQVEVIVALHHSLHHTVHTEASGGTEQGSGGHAEERQRERDGHGSRCEIYYRLFVTAQHECAPSYSSMKALAGWTKGKRARRKKGKERNWILSVTCGSDQKPTCSITWLTVNLPERIKERWRLA